MVYSLFWRHGLHILQRDWVWGRFNAALFGVEESQIIFHEADEPYSLVGFLDAQALSCHDRHTSLMPSPSKRQATKRRRSSITELTFPGINTSCQMAKSVTHVSGTFRYLCLGSLSAAPDTQITNK